MLLVPGYAQAIPSTPSTVPATVPTLNLQVSEIVKPIPKPDYTTAVLDPLYAAQKQEAIKYAAQQAAALKAAQEAATVEAATVQVQPFSQVPPSSPASAGVGGYSNNYDWGNCTWYVASQISVPPSMGDATNWGYGLANAGWIISDIPTVGAIGISHAGSMGHVVIVRAISGGQVEVSEMNYEGLGVVDQRWTSISDFVYAVR